MSIYLRPTSFSERRSSGECFILLILLCRNISDTVHGTTLPPPSLIECLISNYYWHFSSVESLDSSCKFKLRRGGYKVILIKHVTVTRYHEADMRTGKATYWQLTSLQAFWPGLQAGNLKLCHTTSIMTPNLRKSSNH